jgi:hypothetical protein
VSVRHLAQHADQLAGTVKVLRQEQRVPGPDPVGGPVGPVVAAGQQALRQRAVGDHDPAGPGGERQQVLLGRAISEAVADLVAQHPAAQRLLGAPPARQRVVTDADLPDQPDTLQRAHAPHDRAVGDHRVRPVHLIQVKQARAQPAGAGHGALLYDRRQRQDREELRGQENRPPPPAECLPEDALAAPETIHLGGVEQRDAQVDRPADDVAGHRTGVTLPVSPLLRPELPCAQPYLGNPCGRVDVQIPHAGPLLLFLF